jgi:N-sulfoglucosamine sulfohydrolase
MLNGPNATGSWNSWDEVAKTDPKAAAVIKRYHVRPEFELDHGARR